MISKITAFIIGSNYPENIHISSYEKDDKHGYAIYLLKDHVMHSLLVSTGHIFDSDQAANEDTVKLCESCLDVELFGVKARRESNEIGRAHV